VADKVRRERSAIEPDLERVRRESLLVDRVTGLKLHPFAELPDQRIANLGIVYIQLGRFSGVEPVYGWELYDRILKLVADSLRADVGDSPLAAALRALQFNGADGFYALYDLPTRGGATNVLEDESQRLRSGILRRMRKALGSTAVDLMSVHATSLRVRDDPRVRPARSLLRGIQEAARLVGVRQSRDKQLLVQQLKRLLANGGLRAVFQPVVDIQTSFVLGYEALIRGPVGSALESPNLLFAAARDGGLELELENLCLEQVFSDLPAPVLERKLFVNASCRLLQHAVFLDERNLESIRAAHSRVVMEISEKEIVRDYGAFREVLERLRRAGLEIAIDDAGSGYSGLESILQMCPEYIKVADTIVNGLHADGIKRQIITALTGLGRQIKAAIIAEGIEEDVDLKSLLELGVEYGQGFLLGRPAAEVAA
jgi:EAL domain-containing protein (putative c-di-GMP-specific phosphodiesterase class I)